MPAWLPRFARGMAGDKVYVAKHLEMGAVVAGAPAANVRREVPAA